VRWPVDKVIISQGVVPGHVALDFAANMGMPVLAPVSGVVWAVGTNPKYEGGLYVIIREDHQDGWEYYTGHHSRILVQPGQHVTEGQQIAEIGATGKATGPHTHFQVRKRGAGDLLDPEWVYTQRNKKENIMHNYNRIVPPEQVRQRYREVLGREPESEAVLQNRTDGELWEAMARENRAVVVKTQKQVTEANRIADELRKQVGTSVDEVTINGVQFVRKGK
jgi:murein DD-endopeptidase MepM/ murein hydrolase activator NlpD